MIFEHILVTTDLSDSSKTAFDIALHMAKMSSGHITLLSVFDEFSVPPILKGEFKDSERLEAMRIEYEASKQEALETLVQEYFHRHNVAPKVIFSSLTPSEEIVAFAEKELVNLIVIATHGRGAIRNFFMGSVTQRVIREVECPVLVIPYLEP